MRVIKERLSTILNGLFKLLFPFLFQSPKSKPCSHHNGVQLLLNGLVCVLGVLIWVVHGEGFSEKQRGVSTHLKIRSLQTQN